jgi:hypothetical protein
VIGCPNSYRTFFKGAAIHDAEVGLLGRHRRANARWMRNPSGRSAAELAFANAAAHGRYSLAAERSGTVT